MDESLKWFLRTKAGREFRIEKILEATPKEKNWQSFHTPYNLCEKMILKTDVKGKSILVLFNIEFVKVLIEKFGVHSNNITFLADCRLESEMATKTFHVNNIVVYDIKDIQGALKNMGKKFDLCFSNPPYTGSTDFDIILTILPVCNEIIVIHPAAWLLDNKNLSRSYFTKYKEKVKGLYKEIEIFDGNPLFGIIGPCSPFNIGHIDKKYSGKVYTNYFGDSFEVDDIFDITVFGKFWLLYVKSFFITINNFINQNNNIWEWNNRIKKEIPEEKYYCQFRSQEPGTKDKSGKYMYGEDFYTIIQKNTESERYKISYDDVDLSDKRIKFFFDTGNERNNFIEYLKTDFVRFCISIFKSNENLHRKELCLIPVMDFTQEWTDEKLYEFFNIPQETIDYITNFFPDDIYGLRNNS